MKKKINNILFKIFWKTKDELIENDDNTMSLQCVLTPRFGKIGAIIWFILTDDGKFIVERKDDENRGND